MARICLTVLLVAMAGALVASPRVAWWHPPAFVPDTEDVIYRVRVPPNDANKKLIVAAFDSESPDPVSRSDRDLNGNSPALFTFKWRLPAGHLQLTAVLYDAGGIVARDVWAIRVTSRFGDEPEEEP